MADDIAIKVENVSKTFKLPHEKTSSLKSSLINFRSHKSYELQEALKNVSFEVKKGEFFGIVGRNGSGKSTLLKLLAGIYSPSQGEINVRGKLTPFIELGVGFNPELTGRENVFLNGALLGFNRKEMNAMYQDIVNFAELEQFMDQKLKNYSSGMQVRLAFSIAIRARSDILLLDEVLAVGDAAFQQKCFNYFEALKIEKKTVVFVSHDMGAIRRFCTKAIFIDNGNLLHEGTSPDVADLYIKDNLDHEQKMQDPKRKATLKPSRNRVETIIKSQTESKVTLQISFDSQYKEDMYVGISIIKDGLSVAEITTPTEMKLRKSGKLTYILDTTIFNSGVYQITSVLCKQKNRGLISISPDKPKFIIKNMDITRGAALKLDNTWQKS